MTPAPSRLILLPALAVLALLPSCTTVDMHSTWKDSSYNAKLSRVLVVGVTKSIGRRHIFEDTLVQHLEGRGVQAVSSAQVLPASEGQPDQDEIRRYAADRGFDAILTTHLVRVDQETLYHPPRTYVVTRPDYGYYHPGYHHHGYRHHRGYYGHFDHYYPHVYEYVTTPGYTSQHENVVLESNLYSAADGKLVWTTTSESFDPGSAEDLFRVLSENLVNQLASKGLLR